MEVEIQMTSKKVESVCAECIRGIFYNRRFLRPCAAMLPEFVIATETIRYVVAKPEDFRYSERGRRCARASCRGLRCACHGTDTRPG